MADWGDGKPPVCSKYTALANNADDWGVTSAAAVPLPNDDMDFGFGAPVVSAAKNNIIVTTGEVPADKPAATPDAGDDWGDASSALAAKAIANDKLGFGGDDFRGPPAAGRDSGFGDDGFGDDSGDGFGGGVSAGLDDDDAFGDAPSGENAIDLTGTLLTGEDAYNSSAGGPIEPSRKNPTSISR